VRGALGVPIALAVLASGCGLLPKATPDPGVPCEQVYDPSTCVDLMALATAKLRLEAGEIVALTILPEPSPPPGTTLGGAIPIRVRYQLKDGSSHEAALCGGASMEPVCSARPRARPS
jgi:hypothetical protein